MRVPPAPRASSRTVAVIGGAGGVGASIGLQTMLLGDAYDVVLFDKRAHLAASHAMDMRDALGLAVGGRIRVGEATDCVEADLVVFAAAMPPRPSRSRMEFLVENLQVLEQCSDLLLAARGPVFVVSNPVDQLVTWLWAAGIPRHRVFGYSLNDSLRYRSAIASELGVRPWEVEGWVIGEHGEHVVPLPGTVRVPAGRQNVPTEVLRTADAHVRQWYSAYTALSAERTSSWTTGLGVARMIRSMFDQDRAIWPASVVLDGEYGIAGVSVGVPAWLNPGGIAIEQWSLSTSELRALRAAADAIKRSLSGLAQSAAAPVTVGSASD